MSVAEVPIAVETEPDEVGLDAQRLARIGSHFDRYVDDGRLAGWLALVARRGQVAYLRSSGWRDKEAGLPVEVGTRWRIFSMTKPITSVAAMMLWEEGAFELKDPISKWIPAFADARVFDGEGRPTVALQEPIRVWHLLTHTAGLTYGFHYANAVDALYRAPASSGANPVASIWPAVATPGRGSRWSFNRAANGTTQWPPMCSAGWSRCCRG